MNQQPNSNPFEQNIYNGGPPYGQPGHIVTAGQYALDWITALGGTVTLSNNDTTIDPIAMPLDTNGIPVAMPARLTALVNNNRESLIAAVRGKVWPPLCP